MTTKEKQIAQNPLIIRCHRLMEAFAKSDDERDYYLDRVEGALIYVDLDKAQEEIDDLEKELVASSDRYVQIPKLTFYEIKKIMEGFVNEKVYDIDTKEKLLDIIQSKEARENFLEFIYDHHSELEKWQQYYQERFRVRIIEWLRNNRFDFVFEEDLELPKSVVEKLKMNVFATRVPKDILGARKVLAAKAKTYYSNEALNPRPKRGRPPKQVVKVEAEPQFSQDIYVGVAKPAKPFLFTPEYQGTASIFTFSGKFASEEDLLAHRRQQIQSQESIEMQSLNQKLQALRTLSTNWVSHGAPEKIAQGKPILELNGEEVAKSADAVVEGLPKARHGLVVRKSQGLRVKAAASKTTPKGVAKKGIPNKSGSIKSSGSQKAVKKSPAVKVAKKASVKKPVEAKKAVKKERLRTLPLKVKAPKKVAKSAAKPAAKSATSSQKKSVVKKPALRPIRKKVVAKKKIETKKK